MMKFAPEREPCADLFKLHANALAVLEELEGELSSQQTLVFLNGYLAKVMQWSGNQAQLSQCMGCQKPLESLERSQHVSCVVADAGWICSSCREQGTLHVRERSGETTFSQTQMRMTPAALRDFQTCLSAPIRQLPSLMIASRVEHRALFAFIEALLEFHLPGFSRESLRSLRFLDLDGERKSSLQAAEPSQV